MSLRVVCLSLSVCGGRLVAAIRAALVKGRGGEDRAYAAIDQTARALKESIGQLHGGQQGGDANAVGTGISPARVMPVEHVPSYCRFVVGALCRVRHNQSSLIGRNGTEKGRMLFDRAAQKTAGSIPNGAQPDLTLEQEVFGPTY
jgi:hypothetical protein